MDLEDKRIWTIKDCMAYTGLGRKSMTRVLNRTDCPLLPRSKNVTYRVPSAAFIKWWEGGHYEAI